MIGIYGITNTVTGQMYIGRSVRMDRRIYGHRRMLRKGIHDNPYLQASFNKYGEDAFTMRYLVQCRREDAPFYEQRIIAGYRSDNPKLGFNMTLAIDDILTHTAKARAAISAFQRRYQMESHYVMTDEIREKIAAGLRGKVGCNKGRIWPDEIKAKFGAPKGNKNRLGKTRTPEERAKISAGVKARYAADPSLQAAQSAQRKGKPSGRLGIPHTDEAKAKIGAANKGKQPRLGTKHTDEAKAKMSAARKAHPVTDEARANMAAAQRRRQAAMRGQILL
jgi:group I intron endonuclease